MIKEAIITEKRLKTLLYNALCVIENECLEFLTTQKDNEQIDWLQKEVGITKEELKEIEFI